MSETIEEPQVDEIAPDPTEEDEGADDEELEDDEPEPVAAVSPEDRCEAVTTVGGNQYRCALTAEHDDEHRFQPVIDETAPQPDFDPKALSRESKRHETALEKVYGPAWEQFVCCPLCEGDGFMTPKPAGTMPSEQFTAVTALAGQMQAPELQNDEDYVVCGNCAGWGQTNIKDSKREGLSKQCDRCLGAGFVKTTNVTAFPQLAPIPGPAGAGAALPVTSYGAPGPDDAWGRPTGHTHYGIPPAAVT